MRPIETAEIAYYPVPGLAAAERALAMHWERRDVAPFRPEGIVSKPVAVAEVNHGRWIVKCPFCTSAQFAAKGDHRFFCVSCINESVGRQWVRVTWPASNQVANIEAALLARPERDFMHWLPGQKVATLLIENAAGFHHSWTAPRTWAVGEVVTAALGNTHWRDNLLQTAPAIVTTAGDLVYATAANALARLGASASKLLRMNSGGTAPEWVTPYDYICINDTKAQNTNGGTFTSGDWRTRVLNTEQADTGSHAAVASNQITLEAGTYRCRITCPVYGVDNHQARLRNITDGTTVIEGTSQFSSNTLGLAADRSEIVGRFTLAAQKVLEVQHQCATTVADVGFGRPCNFTNEIYTVVELAREPS